MILFPLGRYRGQPLEKIPTLTLRWHVRRCKKPRLRSALLRELNTRPDRLAPAPKRRPRVEPVHLLSVVALGVFPVGDNAVGASLHRDCAGTGRWHVGVKWRRPPTATDSMAWHRSSHADLARATALYLEVPATRLATVLCEHNARGARLYAETIRGHGDHGS